MTWAQFHVSVKHVLRVEISRSWPLLKLLFQMLTLLYWFLPQHLPSILKLLLQMLSPLYW